MGSISKKTGKVFHGKFADLAVRLGLADPIENTEEKKEEKAVDMTEQNIAQDNVDKVVLTKKVKAKSSKKSGSKSRVKKSK